MSLWRFIIGSTMGDQTGSATFICRDATGSQRVIVGSPIMEIRKAIGRGQR
jgi:hypothetical protein